MRSFILISLSLSMLAFGCGRKSSVGEPASPDTPATALAQILSAPQDYHGHTVVLKGRAVAQCASLCDFTYREARDSVTIYMGETERPRLRSGQRVRATVTVHHGENQTIFTAVGLELLPESEGS